VLGEHIGQLLSGNSDPGNRQLTVSCKESSFASGSGSKQRARPAGPPSHSPTFTERVFWLVHAEMPGDGMDVQEPKDQQHDSNEAHEG
jgi:hypothetical protein